MNFMNNIEYAELAIDTVGGYHFSLDLSPAQLAVICKILGFTFSGGGEVSYFSDDTLEKLVGMNGNPLRLQEKK